MFLLICRQRNETRGIDRFFGDRAVASYWAGGLNTVISLFYYLRIVETMIMDPEPENRPPFSFSTVSLQGAYIWLVTVPVLLLFFVWDWLNLITLAAAENLF